MNRSARFVTFARTTRGQLTLIGVLYGAALLAACTALSLRGAWFAGTVREKFPDPEKNEDVARWQALARDIASGRREPTELKTLGDAELTSIYGVLLDEPDVDPAGRLLDAFRSERPEALLARLRRTLAAGNQPQRLRALGFLETMPTLKFVSEVRALSGYALARARRLGEPEVAAVAARVLRHFESHLSH